MDWTKSYFDETYLKYFLDNQSEERTKKQVDFVARYFSPGSYILDAGCGIGRHSIKLGEKGFKVLGIDSSPLYIDVAKKRNTEKGLSNVSFKTEDMRNISYVNKFDGIISLWSSFGYFDDKTNEHILVLFFRALKSGGKLIIDVENRDYILKYFVRETFREKDDVFILERRRFHPLTSIVTTHRYMIGKNMRKDYIRHIRIYSATEISNMFIRTGFKNMEIFGDYDSSKFSERSKRVIIVGEKV
jgi:SAM-dependent methyltransferase